MKYTRSYSQQLKVAFLKCFPKQPLHDFNQKILTTQTEIRKKVFLILIRGDSSDTSTKNTTVKLQGNNPWVHVLQLQKQLLVASREHNWKATPIKDLKVNILRDLTEVAGLQMGRADPKPSEKEYDLR